MGSSIFAATSRLKFVSTIRASCTSMSSTERKRKKIYPWLVEMLTMFVLIFFPPPSQESSHWIFFVGVTVWVPESHFNYGLSLTLP